MYIFLMQCNHVYTIRFTVMLRNAFNTNKQNKKIVIMIKH